MDAKHGKKLKSRYPDLRRDLNQVQEHYVKTPHDMREVNAHFKRLHLPDPDHHHANRNNLILNMNNTLNKVV